MDANMNKEIRMLRATIKTAQDSLRGGDGNLAKMGALLARLSDSVGRALLVQQKLAANNTAITQAQHELDDLLRQWKEIEEED